MSRLSRYTLWAPSWGSPYVSRDPPGRGWKEDRESWWRLTVRAYSVRQAVYVAANWIRASDGGPGIVDAREPTKGAQARV